MSTLAQKVVVKLGVEKKDGEFESASSQSKRERGGRGKQRNASGRASSYVCVIDFL
jgi:hypothetical protein